MKTPPPGLQNWLDYPISITDKLKAHTPEVRLTCLKEGWGMLDSWETRHLPNTEIFRREILMYAGQHTCWYARTMIPKTTYLGEAARFERLGRENLGQIIWQASDIKRQHMAQFSLTKSSFIYKYLETIGLELNEETLWGRLSTFTIKHTLPFYLLEIFLPELQHYYA